MTEAEGSRIDLTNGLSVVLTRDAVLSAAAASAPIAEGDEGRALVVLDDHRYDAMALVAKALNVGADLIRPRLAFRALQDLKMHIEDGVRIVAPKDDGADEFVETDLETVGGERVDVTPDLALELQRRRGRWVAARDGYIVADSESLSSLLEDVGRLEVTVLYVPQKDEAG